MRYKHVDTSPAGNTQHWIALGIQDIEILLGFVNAAISRMPRLTKESEPEYNRIYQRVRSINKGLKEALIEAKRYDDPTRT